MGPGERGGTTGNSQSFPALGAEEYRDLPTPTPLSESRFIFAFALCSSVLASDYSSQTPSHASVPSVFHSPACTHYFIHPLPLCHIFKPMGKINRKATRRTLKDHFIRSCVLLFLYYTHQYSGATFGSVLLAVHRGLCVCWESNAGPPSCQAGAASSCTIFPVFNPALYRQKNEV